MRPNRYFTDMFLELLLYALLLLASKSSAFVENDEVYRLKWAATLPNYKLPSNQNSEEAFRNAVKLRTKLDEEYYCLIPDATSTRSQNEKDEAVENLSEMKLLKPLFDSHQCSYKIESYWSYELCHGRHLRQFHEVYDASGKLVTSASQTHFLGYYKERSNADESTSHKASKKPKTLQMDGIEYAYFSLEYGDGARCDLTGQPRRAVIKYICNIDGRGEIVTMKETSTCEYELVISVSLLCQHPSYDRRGATAVANIFCHPAHDAPALPREYARFAKQSSSPPRVLPAIPNGYDFDSDLFDSDANEDDDGRIIVIRDSNSQVVIKSSRTTNSEATADTKNQQVNPEAAESSSSRRGEETPTAEQNAARLAEIERRRKEQLAAERYDSLLLREFVTGEYCLDGGGSGWWQYHICFNKEVTQFHVEGSVRTTIVLGVWNRAKHLEWVAGDSKRRPKTNTVERRDVSQMYFDGDTCAETGRKRQVEVKFRCPANQQSAGVSLMLLEPQTCEYVLVAEWRIFCKFNPLVDSDGLLPADAAF